MPENALQNFETSVKLLMPDILSDGINLLDSADMTDNLPIIKDLSSGVHELFELIELINRLERVG